MANISLAVDDVYALEAHLKEKGVGMFCPAGILPSASTETGTKHLLAFIADPDGYWTELMRHEPMLTSLAWGTVPSCNVNADAFQDSVNETGAAPEGQHQDTQAERLSPPAMWKSRITLPACCWSLRTSTIAG